MILYAISLMKYLPKIHTVKFLKEQQERDKDKGETLTYAVLRIHKRLFNRTVDYVKHGALDVL